MLWKSPDAKRRDAFRSDEASLVHGDILQSAAIRECRDRNKAAMAEARKELEQASEALRQEPSEANTARYMRAVRKMQELREERKKLWGAIL